jgi:MFS family permease
MADIDMRDLSVGDLVQRLSQQTAALVREELHLAQVELKHKAKKGGMGIGLLGAAGIVALFAVGAAVAAVILLIAEALAAWISAFIVAGALLLVAGVMALAGKKEVDEATPPKPEATIQTVQADVAEIKERARR